MEITKLVTYVGAGQRYGKRIAKKQQRTSLVMLLEAKHHPRMLNGGGYTVETYASACPYSMINPLCPKPTSFNANIYIQAYRDRGGKARYKGKNFGGGGSQTQRDKSRHCYSITCKS